METEEARITFTRHLKQAVETDNLVKLTLGKPVEENASCRNVFVRPLRLKAGPHLSFVERNATNDITQNLSPDKALERIAAGIGTRFLDAHLYTTQQSFELRCHPGARDRLIIRDASNNAPRREQAHDRAKVHPIPPQSPWLRALGITNDRGEPRADMSSKYRQIQKYAELLRHLLAESQIWPLEAPEAPALKVVDMGCGKGYLTFAIASLLGPKSTVIGVELRPELVKKSNDLARQLGMSQLSFLGGSIQDAPLDKPDIVVALHACDTATDDAFARGIEAGAKLLVAAPCCQKELRPQLKAPDVLAEALRHGIFRERQAEFVTDALRAELLEWAGFKTKVFEFISTEHTAKNLMIAAMRSKASGDPARSQSIQQFMEFYGIRSQRLAQHLHFPTVHSSVSP